jgi:hypothetical protein
MFMEEAIFPPIDSLPTGAIVHSGKSAASWGAIIAGAFVAAGGALIMLTLGAGLGFASVSPWVDRGVTAKTFTVTTAIWLIVTQWICAGLGGYIAGRLRTRWVGTHSHEVFFRDTAHGLVTWAVSTIVIATVVASSLFSALSGGVHAVSGAAAGGTQGMNAATSLPMASYSMDRLFRSAVTADGGQGMGDSRVEAGHIMANAITAGIMPDADRSYLANVVATKTGISPADAQKRVDDYVSSAMEAEAKVKSAAETARKAAAQASIYTALSLLIGAFIASVAATLGGQLRDEHL